MKHKIWVCAIMVCRLEVDFLESHRIAIVSDVIDYIEAHLGEKIDLECIAGVARYSKYHLHRIFVDTVGMTIHDYVHRRQLTEAAKLLVFSDKPIIEIAFLCGYESQRSFSFAFKSMYKLPPAQFRCNRIFYPLQLKWSLNKYKSCDVFTEKDIRIAVKADLNNWIDLMRLVIDGYPFLDEADYCNAISKYIDDRHAIVLYDQDLLVGAMAFSVRPGSIDFLGIHPQYRKSCIQALFLKVLLTNYLPDQEISITTFREGDKADTGYRDMLKQLGFAERELLTEYGYPTQRFSVIPEK